MDDFWGEPISVYTDKDALEDGTIVDISLCNVRFQDRPINRMTGTLFADFKPFLLDFEGAPPWYLQLRSTLKTKLRYALETGTLGSDWPYKLPPTLWLVPNEVDGWTLMWPSDY